MSYDLRFVRNEADLPIADCGFRIADWGRTSAGAADCTKRTQFPAGDVPRDSIIPVFQSHAYRAKRTQSGRSGGVPEGEMCETNPIRASVAPADGTECAKRTQSATAQRNRWGKPHPTRGRNCAKRTQFGPAGRQTGSREGETCKTKPICPREHKSREGVGKAKPASARRADPMDLEQTIASGGSSFPRRREAAIRHRMPATPMPAD